MGIYAIKSEKAKLSAKVGWKARVSRGGIFERIIKPSKRMAGLPKGKGVREPKV